MYLLIYILYILLIIRKNKNKFYINIIYIESQQTFFMYVCTSLPRPVTCHMVMCHSRMRTKSPFRKSFYDLATLGRHILRSIEKAGTDGHVANLPSWLRGVVLREIRVKLKYFVIKA